MSQSEVIGILKKSKEPLSLGQISELLGYEINTRCAYKSVSRAICHLLKYREIKAIEIDRNEAMKRYNCKRRIRLYYI